MFLTEEENLKLTQVGPGTPGGELLRRYWHPVAGLHLLTDEAPTAHVRLLGEDLVLFRDKSGRVGLLADHCSHRGASLLYGRVEERGIACAYHGWLYDTSGNCLETPAEPEGSHFHLTVKHQAYPVQKYLGLYWAYLGPVPVPPMRQLDLAAYPVKCIQEMPFEANWVQVVDNNLDGTHVIILHQDVTSRNGTVQSTTRGLIDELSSLEYEEVPFGIFRRLSTRDGFLDVDPLVFPNMLRRINELSIKVPVDDTHTRKFMVYLTPQRDGYDSSAEQEPVDYYVVSPDEPKNGVGVHPNIRHRMDKLTYQDVMAIETQGRVAPRQNWHVATGDRGVLLFERMLLREMDRVQAGHDPLGVIRDPAQVIDTNFEFYRSNGARQLPIGRGDLVYARKTRAGTAVGASAGS
jgi:5,5'-dehydrodivanillate O-demethylase oxygenase subunit